MGRWILLAIGYLAVVAVNGMANALPINNQTTGDIANRIEVLFTPAGYVFSIWGLIYTLLAVWLVRRWPLKTNPAKVDQRFDGLFLISCVFNVGWILLWHYNIFLWTIPVMVSLLIVLIAMFLRMKQLKLLFWDRIAFVVYLGWISVATVANISYVLVDYGWSGWGISAPIWTMIMITIATMLGCIFYLREHERAYVYVLVWALIGIGVKQWSVHFEIVTTAWIGATLLLLMTFASKIFFAKATK